MTEIDKIMVDDGSGGQKQIYPQSHAEAIIGLEKFIKAHGGGSGGTGEKGEKGEDAVINIISQADYDRLTDKSGVYFIEG